MYHKKEFLLVFLRRRFQSFRQGIEFLLDRE